MSRLPLALLLLFAGACVEVSPTEEIDPRVTILPHEPGRDVTVGDDLLIFAAEGNGAILGAEPGDVFVSASGQGFLRRVESVQSQAGAIIVHTSEAALDDAIIDGSIETSLDVSYDQKLDKFGVGKLAVGLDNQTVMDSDSLRAHVHHAELAVTPVLEVNAEIHRRALEFFSLVLSGTATAELDVELTLKIAEAQPPIRLFKAPPQVYVQLIGWLPIAETIETEVGLRIEATGEGAATVRLKGGAAVSLAGGAVFDGSWHAISAENHSFHGEIPFASLIADDLAVRVYLYTEVNVKFYGIAGPSMNMGPYLQVDHPLGTNGWTPSAGLYGEVWGEMKAFGFGIPVMPKIELFDVNVPL